MQHLKDIFMRLRTWRKTWVADTDLWEGITHPPKFVSILKYTATPSPRHPATLLVLLVSPDFSKAPDSHPVCYTFSLGQFRFL